ncbi:L10-interacting MYB domain-containing protein-like [Senna tora]|uniref:L10-interacting MYB domain-containing protein-like n=1 Tax=Senna tora TaxID=362788 RepID=A0A834TGZ4_9FABA|nr:L10-interacting MYB domain-containing protein-like [Senna tora]
MRKPIVHYDKMMVIYGNDRATGQVSTTAKEKRKRSLIDETESLDTINASSEMGNQDLGDDNAITSHAMQIVQDLGENNSKKNKKLTSVTKKLNGLVRHQKTLPKKSKMETLFLRRLCKKFQFQKLKFESF